jgi:lambda family phage minor tail protein L
VDIDDLTQRSTLPAYVELFDIDCSAITGIGTIYRLTPNVGSNNSNIMFGGDAYTPFPIQITSYAQDSDSAPARPTLSISNVSKLFGMLSFTFQDIIGARDVYYRTFANYLGQSTKVSAAPLKFTIARKTAHSMGMLSFELRSPLDSERAVLPKRQMLKKDFPGLGINKVM